MKSASSSLRINRPCCDTRLGSRSYRARILMLHSVTGSATYAGRSIAPGRSWSRSVVVRCIVPTPTSSGHRRERDDGLAMLVHHGEHDRHVVRFASVAAAAADDRLRDTSAQRACYRRAPEAARRELYGMRAIEGNITALVDVSRRWTMRRRGSLTWEPACLASVPEEELDGRPRMHVNAEERSMVSRRQSRCPDEGGEPWLANRTSKRLDGQLLHDGTAPASLTVKDDRSRPSSRFDASRIALCAVFLLARRDRACPTCSGEHDSRSATRSNVCGRFFALPELP